MPSRTMRQDPTPLLWGFLTTFLFYFTLVAPPLAFCVGRVYFIFLNFTLIALPLRALHRAGFIFLYFIHNSSFDL